jgi:hypothetical protein
MSPETGLAVGERWAWILDMVFGAIIAFGFQRLEEGLRASAKSSMTAFLKHLFMASGFIGFVIYDIGVYHILIKKFPYDVSELSAVRYVLDLLMAFLLMVILVRGLSIDAGKHVFEILIALSMWHIAAMCWHFAASMQINGSRPELKTFSPHILFVMIYWSTFALWYLTGAQDRQSKLAEPTGFLVWLALPLLLISIWRSNQMIQTFVSEPATGRSLQAAFHTVNAGQSNSYIPLAFSSSSLQWPLQHCHDQDPPSMYWHRFHIDLNAGLKSEIVAFKQ